MEFFKGMVCPVCETGRLETSRENLEFEYKGVKTVIPERNVFKCHECEESVVATL